MKFVYLVLMLIVTASSSCGRNNGTPLPTDRESLEDNDLPLGPTDDSDLQLSDAKKWRAELDWTEQPRFSDEEILDLTGLIFVRNVDGGKPTNVSKIELIADMPQHGHGTGNNVPSVHATDSDPSRFTFENVIFTMQGSWRIRILATVDGREDVWTTWVDVR